MSCHDARERFSELIDGTLDPGTREAVDAHVSGCPECRRELDRLERTVALLRTVEPVRAPVGFVDRVLDAAKPVPWYRRVGERLARVRPLGVPIEAAAIVLVATLAVYVFERTPDLQQAAREEGAQSVLGERPDVMTKARPGPVTTFSGDDAPRSPAVPDHAARASDRQGGAKQGGAEGDTTSDLQVAPGSTTLLATSETAPPPKASLPEATSGPPGTRSPARRHEVGPDPAPGAPSGAHGDPAGSPDAASAVRVPAMRPDAPGATPDTATRSDASGAGRAPATRPDVRDAVRDPATRPGASAAAPAVPESLETFRKAGRLPDADTSAGSNPAESRPRRQSSTGIGGSGSEASPPPRAVVPYAMPPSPVARSAPRITGRLAVADQETADRDLAALVSRVGGAEVERRVEGPIVVVDVIVPGPHYAAFSSGLARIGTWTADTPPSDLPTELTVTLRMGR